jgi:tripartite-type tricarboxylate transporter receptor subunit TctC
MLSEVPTFAELGYDGFDVRLWVGLFARKQVPQDKLQKMEQAALGVLASDDMQAALLKNGLEPMALDAKAFTEFVNVEIDRWTAIGTELR